MIASLRPRFGSLAARAIATLALTASIAACDDPAPLATAAATAATSTMASAAPTASSAATAAPSVSASAARAPGERDIAGAQHIVVAWKGADRAPKAVTRTKPDARKRAEEALAKLKDKGEPFEKLVKEYSDDEASRPAAGAVGNFERNARPEAFANATFALEVGGVTGVVETPAGYSIIKRTR